MKKISELLNELDDQQDIGPVLSILKKRGIDKKIIEHIIDEKISEYKLEFQDEIRSMMKEWAQALREAKGDKGDKPTREELLEIIEPLIPNVEDGHSPTNSELLDLIIPLIPEVKDGHTPTKNELIDIIIPLIPQVKDGKTPTKEELVKIINTVIPNTEDIVKNINDLPIEPRFQIDASHIKNLPKSDTVVSVKGKSKVIYDIIYPSQIIGDLDGSNTIYYLPKSPKSYQHLELFVDNTIQEPIQNFTMVGNQITMGFALQPTSRMWGKILR